MTDQTPAPLATPQVEEPSTTVAPVGAESPTPTAAEAREEIEAAALEAAEVAESTAKVNLSFPVVGFIDPVEQLEVMRRLSNAMDEMTRRLYPEKIRAKLLAHAADAVKEAVTDEELALAIFIKRTTDTPLTAEDLEAKATGKSPKKAAAPKEKKLSKEEQGKKTLDDLFGGI